MVSVPVKKNAIINSSKDKVKPSNKLAMIPGYTSGRITRRNVPIGVSPRSRDASSKIKAKTFLVSSSIDNYMEDKLADHKFNNFSESVSFILHNF